MRPRYTEQNYLLTEEEIKKTLGIGEDERLLTVTLHENKDGNKVELITGKGEKRVNNFIERTGGY